MADHRLAVQNAYLAYHLVRRNLVNNNVDVSGLPTASLSAHPGLEEEEFKRAVCILEKGNDTLMEQHKDSIMRALDNLDISDTSLHSEFSKLANAVISDEIRWGRITSLFFMTSLLAEKLIGEGRGATVKALVRWLALFLDADDVAHWIINEGGWCMIKCVIQAHREESDRLKRLLYQFQCWLLTLGTTRGGFRNLLLDGWWLEFWEIILLAAGDVERNPGPTFMTENELAAISNTPIGESYLSGVFDEVRPISSKWYQLCCCLGILASRLDAINRTQNGDCDLCLVESLKEWLRRNYNTEEHGSPTWRKLVAAVDNSAGGNNHVLALTVAEKHKIAIGSRDDRKRSEEMSSAFRNMYRSVIPLLRQVDVHEVVDSLRYLTDPASHTELCIPPQVYRRATSTKDLLAKLCPKYVNPRNTFILEDIVANFGSRRCKRLVQEYIDKFM